MAESLFTNIGSPQAHSFLIAPLNWGLGHASRCIPIIDTLLKEGRRVVIAADGLPLALLREEFPLLETVCLPSPTIRYSRRKTQLWAMLGNLPAILGSAVREHRQLKKIIRQYGIDFVISDNRFGLWSRQVPCVYITHQLMIKLPQRLRRFETLLWRIHRVIINCYCECWIPDFAGNDNLSGDLSHKYPLPPRARFIGCLSRFTHTENILPRERFHTVAVLSGVEPQRRLFEQELIKTYAGRAEKTLIVQGLPLPEQVFTQHGNLSIVSHLPAKQLKACLLQAQEIICRSGYSSIMDLHALGLQATLVATPGQPEQEYLAAYHQKENKF